MTERHIFEIDEPRHGQIRRLYDSALGVHRTQKIAVRSLYSSGAKLGLPKSGSHESVRNPQFVSMMERADTRQSND